MRYLILFILIAACNKQHQSSPTKERLFNGEYALECVRVDRYLQRCENSEAVCYVQPDYRGGVTCRFK